MDLENLDVRGVDANFWRVDESHDYDADIMRCEILADQALAYCRQHSNPMLIGLASRWCLMVTPNPYMRPVIRSSA